MVEKLNNPVQNNWGIGDFYVFAVKNFGLDPITAWDYTPYEIRLIAEHYAIKAKDKLKSNITEAYYTEYFARHKKLPKLHKVLREIDKPTSGKQTKGDMVLRAMARDKGVII